MSDQAEQGEGDSALDRLAAVIDGEEAPVDDATTAVARVLLSEQYRGPFPHPSNLREFDDIVSNGAERAFALTEKEQNHRHAADDRLMDLEFECRRAENYDRRLLIWLSFLLAVLGIMGVVVLLAMGQPVGGGILGGAAILAGLGGALFAQRRSRQRPSLSRDESAQ
jgi:uncharacterized membrane protein